MVNLREQFIPYPAATANRPGKARPGRPLGATLHWMVGYLGGTDALFKNPATGYATNLGIGIANGEYVVHEYVPVDQVAWGNGNTFLNTYSVSIEHENDRTKGITSKPTPETHELGARTLANLARRFDWRIGGKLQLVLRDFPNHDFYQKSVPGFGTDFNVIGHRAVALKDCPGLLDMGWIVNRANELLDPKQEENDMIPQDLRLAQWYTGNPDNPQETATVEVFLQKILNAGQQAQKAAADAAALAAQISAKVVELEGKIGGGTGGTVDPSTVATQVAPLLEVKPKGS